MDMSSRNMIAEFSGDILGVPSAVVEAGERIVFNKTDDGEKYQQFVIRNDSAYNVQMVFVLGKPDNVPLPKGWFLQYNYTMPTETSLLATFSFFMGTYTAEFEISLTFKPNASGFHDEVRVLNPKQFTGTAEFYRVGDDQKEMEAAKPIKTEL
ncbi:uncharacterized protein LOC129581333 isoform X2 [Paramacrobiotus metropolitanus]|nr:uncharacterized protein LOC129581333 isoform X2 [Paramacrobiotus metropolitanus]